MPYKNKQTQQEYQKQWIRNKKQRNPIFLKKERIRMVAVRRNLKIEVINHYCGKCECCGETAIEFLAIDHINGGGTRHRKEIGVGRGSDFYRWLKKNNYPIGYRVLCHNCNQSLGWYRYCPHKRA